MSVRIAKEFHWEMGHRLPGHPSGCQNLHGHSYRLTVELDGDPNEFGMVMDYGELTRAVMPLVDQLDHAFACWTEDATMRELMERTGMKCVMLPFQTTAENLARWMLERLAGPLARPNVNRVAVRLSETAKVFAEASMEFPH